MPFRKQAMNPNPEFDPNQESGFLVDSSQQQNADANRMSGMIADDDEILKDFQANRSSDAGGITQTLCGCSGSCDCALCNCLSDRAVDQANEPGINEMGRFSGASNKTAADIFRENIEFALQDVLQQNRTDGEGVDLDVIRDQLSGEVGEIVENFVERFQRTDDGDSSINLDSLGFNFNNRNTSDNV